MSSSGGENRSNHLEPRVAKLEGYFEGLVQEVKNLAEVVRSEAEKTEKQIRDLAVQITQASSPRPTPWNVLIGAGGLILALLAAVASPLYQRIAATESVVASIVSKFDNHTQLRLHPVGAEILGGLDQKFEQTAATNRERVESLSKVFDQKFEKLLNDFADVKTNGSPITRERLAILENDFKRLAKDAK